MEPGSARAVMERRYGELGSGQTVLVIAGREYRLREILARWMLDVEGILSVDGGDAVCCPFCAGCGSIVKYPFLEKDASRPRSVLGMFDVSARPLVPGSSLSRPGRGSEAMMKEQMERIHREIPLDRNVPGRPAVWPELTDPENIVRVEVQYRLQDRNTACVVAALTSKRNAYEVSHRACGT